MPRGRSRKRSKTTAAKRNSKSISTTSAPRRRCGRSMTTSPAASMDRRSRRRCVELEGDAAWRRDRQAAWTSRSPFPSLERPVRFGRMPPARNIELKARLHDLTAARHTARRLATESLGIQQQVDTYFHCPEGRLKLRETAFLNPGATDSPLSAALASSSRSELIWYDRADDRQAKQSDYQLIEISAARARQLKREMGIRVIVIKRREVFLHRNVRIHLDEVYGLGEFIEFEAVLGWGIDEAAGHDQVAYLERQFDLAPADLVSGSYADLL